MSTETTYFVERAKTGRAKCKKCKEPIAKGEIRIASSHQHPSGDYDLTSYVHSPCFTLPRKLVKEGMTAESFVNEILEDRTEEAELEQIKEKLIADIDAKPPKKGKKGGDDDGELSRLDKIRAHLKEERDNADEPAAKRIKLSEEEEAMVDVYVQYEKTRADELKDILGWNHQIKTGTRDMLMARVLDGQLHGRLGHCPLCQQGRLQLENEEAKHAICKGYFDEDVGGHIPCNNRLEIKDAPRLHPWFTEEPSEEEKKELDQIDEEAKVSTRPNSAKTDKATADLLEKAKALEWNLDNKAGIQQATASLLELCRDAKVDLPDNEKKAKMDVGKLVAGARSSSAEDVLQLVLDKFGFAEQNAEAAAKKSAAATKACAHPDNAGILEALKELGELYFKAKNTNAGITYKKAVAAISELDYAITEENALGLGKGKSKVAGIGKGTAEKIHEFVTTGTIEKLEEKRKEAA